MNDFSKLDSINVEAVIRLTPMQEGMLFHYLQRPESSDYVEQISLDLRGPVDVELFEKAWGLVVSQNPALRTVFRWEKLDAPVQVALKDYGFKCLFFDYSSLDGEEQKNQYRELLERGRSRGFDLHDVPFRVVWCRFSLERGRMLLTHHHILYDGWSTGILLREFFRFFTLLCNGDEPVLQPKRCFSKYVDYIAACDASDAANFWGEYLECLDGSGCLPFQQREADGYSTGMLRLDLDDKFRVSIQSCVREGHLTSAILYYGAWSLLLYRYLDRNDVVFGTTVSGRDVLIDGIESMTGLFINTLPTRVMVRPGESVEAFLARLQCQLRERDRYFFSSLVEIKSYAGLSGNDAMFETLVVVENYPIGNLLSDDFGPLRIEDIEEFGSTNYDLVLSVGGGYLDSCQFWYRENRFDRSVIQRLASHFKRLLEGLVLYPDRVAGELEIMSDAERRRLLVEFNNSGAQFSTDYLFHELFEEQAYRTPDTIAVISGLHHLTYNQLDRCAESQACWLKRNGCEELSIIGILVERSLEMITGVLGVMKIGAAYLPLAWDYPSRRIELMLADSNAGILITQGVEKAPRDFEGQCLDISHHAVYSENGSHSKRKVSIPKSSLAYVIYTSGSTGQPKGVMIQHDQLVNVAFGWQDQYRLREMDVRLLQIASFSFDVFAGDLARALMNAGCLIICPHDVKTDLCALYTLIRRERVTLFEATPPLVVPLMDWVLGNGLEIGNIELLILGSDKCRMDDFKRLVTNFGKHMRIVNSYGVTEATVDSSYFEYGGGEWPSTPSVPIGKPLPNVKFYVTNQVGLLQPVGVPGELLIGGDSVGRGYLYRRELSSKFFLPDPFRPGGRVYKTGDLVRWLPDGNMEILGRTDQQLKIRGYRIEPGEIEQRLLQRGDITDCVVSAFHDEGGESQLCAYVLCDGILNSTSIREDLAREVPLYMIPTFFIKVDNIPLSSNGKVDVRGLPEPGTCHRSRYVAPRNYIEKTLVSIWAGVLKVDESLIGIDDNFFRLGGHSLKVTMCVAKIHKVLNVRIPLIDIFKHTTIRELAGDIYSCAPDVFRPIGNVEKKDYYKLSAAQKRLYILQQMNLDSTLYNISEIQMLHGDLDTPRLDWALCCLSLRHESLRTSFTQIAEEPVQRIHEEADLSINYFDIRSTRSSSIDPAGEIADGFTQPFDLAGGNLLRLGLIQRGAQEYLLLLDMHHIISDGISEDILVRDLVALYNNRTLPELALQYKDYSEWQHSACDTIAIRRQEKFWLDRFSDDIPVLSLPADYERPSVQDFAGDRIVFDLPRSLTLRLKDIALSVGATLNIVLLASYKVLLFKYTGQEDIVVGVPIAGRTHADLQDVIGMFVNMLPVRSFPRPDKSFGQYLEEVKGILLEAFDNQDYQFDQLVEKLGLQRDPGRFPLFDVSFQVNHIEEQPGEDYLLEGTMDQLQISPFNYKNSQTKLDLVLEGIEMADKITLIQEYSTSLFMRPTVEKLTRRYLAVLNQLAQNLDIPLDEIVLPHELETAEADKHCEEPNDFIFLDRVRF